MSQLRIIRMVLWGFFGIRKNQGGADDLAAVRPSTLIVTGILACAAFVGLLILVARLAVQGTL